MNDFDINRNSDNINETEENFDRTSNNAPEAVADVNHEATTAPNASGPKHEYKYGISYGERSQNGDSTTDNSARSTKQAHKVTSNHRRITVNICFLAFMLLLNFFAIYLGFKLVLDDYEESIQGTEKPEKVPTITVVQIQDTPDSSGSPISNNKPLSKNEVWMKVKDTAVEIKAESVVDEVYGQYHRTVNASGVIVASDNSNNEYYILTNHHVVEGAQTLTVALNNGRIYEARMIGCDSETDLAVISIVSQEPLACASFGVSNSLSVGDDVLTIGNPLGSLGGTAADGIISAVEREVTVDGVHMTLLQTNVAANRGNSGGGLFNMSGHLVGVMNSKYIDEEIEGISFAIPGDIAKDIMVELIAYGYVKGRPDLGLVLSEKTRTYFGSVMGSYVIVTDPRNNENIEVNDLIYSVDGMLISTCNDIKSALRDKKIGDVVTVEISRNRTIIEMQITVVERTPKSGSVEFAPET